jgi:hypothetical protein
MNKMKNEIKYSQIYSEVLESIGADMADSLYYCPKRVIIRMWEKLPNNNYGWSLTDDDLEIIYDL